MNSEKAKKVYKVIMLIIVVALITFVLTSVFMYKKLGTSKYSVQEAGLEPELAKKIYTVRRIMDSEYVSEINEEDLINGAIKGYVEGLGDEYTEYFTKEEMEEFKTETEGKYVGIGIYMYKNTKENTIEVLAPIEDSPAEKAGILPGDVIKKVDGIEYSGDDFEKIADCIKGKEGTTVKLEIERNGETITLEIERKNINLYPIKSEVLENNIGYIEITSFDEDSGEEFKKAYTELSKNNINSLIIDLRNNGGGIVDEALEIADYALEKDKVMLITKGKEGTEEEIEKSSNNPIITVPIVILTNENTASASEILTAALKENGKATVVGEKTYGKGVIQELITLTDGSGIKITSDEYYTPNRNKINKVGITPDKEVSLPETLKSVYNVERGSDTQLKEAIKILKGE